MIVTFDISPAGVTSDYNALYVNFLRCVTAIATAPAGTSSLTVNPYTSTSATDGTKNCITSIVANTEAGGWTTSSSHSIPTYPSSFNAMSSQPSYSGMYKADFYNSSGKSTYPYNKFTIHAVGHNTTGYDSHYSGYCSIAPLTNWTSGYAQIQQTFGCSSTSAGDSGYTPTWSGTTPNQQSTSWTNNAYFATAAAPSGTVSSGSNYSSGNNAGFSLYNYASVTYTMAVTANYCIIWENHKSNSYANGFNNTYQPQYSITGLYGTLMYGGLRTTQAWEDSLGYNNPWCAFTVHHCSQGGSNYQTTIQNSNYFIYSYYTNQTVYFSSYGGQPPNCAAAFMATSDNTGLISSSATTYKNYPHFHHYQNPLYNMCAISGSGYSTAAGVMDYCFGTYSWSGQYGSNTPQALATPLFQQRQRKSNNPSGTTGSTHNVNLPTVDPVTGTYVPGAYPITFARTTNSSWNPGGTAKGIYKSLTMPLSNMKLYWSSGQNFNIGSDTYMPIVFNEDMYLIRYA